MLMTEKKSLFWVSLVTMLVKRELKVRYKGSVFGYLWSMLNPLLYMSILGFVFSHLMRFQTEHYALFLLVGILGWNLFSQGVSMGTQSIVSNAALMKKVRVPCTIFPAASIGSCLTNFVLALIPFFIISYVMTGKVTALTLSVPLFLVPYAAFVFGIALLLASLNVLYRDVQHLLEPVLNMIFYATPIIYPLEALPEKYRRLAGLNPLAYYIEGIRDLMFAGRLPTMRVSAMIIGCAVVSVTCGLTVHRMTRDKFIYRL